MIRGKHWHKFWLVRGFATVVVLLLVAFAVYKGQQFFDYRAERECAVQAKLSAEPTVQCKQLFLKRYCDWADEAGYQKPANHEELVQDFDKVHYLMFVLPDAVLQDLKMRLNEIRNQRDENILSLSSEKLAEIRTQVVGLEGLISQLEKQPSLSDYLEGKHLQLVGRYIVIDGRVVNAFLYPPDSPYEHQLMATLWSISTNEYSVKMFKPKKRRWFDGLW